MSSVFVLIVVLLFTLTENVWSLKCYQCSLEVDGVWINAETLPSFPSNCSVVEAKQQCTASVRWFSGPLQSLVDYDVDKNPKDFSSHPSINIALQRDIHTSSTRHLMYGCLTDNCNDGTRLQRALASATLDEKFAQFDSLLGNETYTFTEQTSCLDFKNTTASCPNSAKPLSFCIGCSVTLSGNEVCARCPSDYPYGVYLWRSSTFLLDDRTRTNQFNLTCRTTACNALITVERIHQASTIEFDFDKFLGPVSSAPVSTFISSNIIASIIIVYAAFF